MKKMLYVFLIIAILGLSAWTYNYWRIGTPEYSLQQLRKAVLNHNVDLAFQYIDYEKVFDGIWEDVSLKMLDMTKKDSFDVSLSSANLLENIKPTAKVAQKKVMEKAFSGEVREGTFSKPTFVNNMKDEEYKITQNKDEVRVEFSSGMKLTLTEYPGRYWKITHIDNLEITSDGKVGI